MSENTASEQEQQNAKTQRSWQWEQQQLHACEQHLHAALKTLEHLGYLQFGNNHQELMRIAQSAQKIDAQVLHLKSWSLLEKMKEYAKVHKLKKVHTSLVKYYDDSSQTSFMWGGSIEVKGGLPRHKNKMAQYFEQLLQLQQRVDNTVWKQSQALNSEYMGKVRIEFEASCAQWTDTLSAILWGISAKSEYEAGRIEAVVPLPKEPSVSAPKAPKML